MADISSAPHCVVCNATDHLKRCSRCKDVFYCSIEHQKRDWFKHKISCAKSSSLRNSNGNQSRILNPKSSSSSSSVTTKENIESIAAQSSVSQKKEIESILDFSSVKEPERSQNTSSSPNSKDIFHELVNSESEDYNGPAANITTSENDFEQADDTNSVDETEATVASEQLKDSDDDFTPFDTHPFCERKFPKPESYHHKDLAEFIVTRLVQFGYCVVDGLFEEQVIDGVISETKSLKDKNGLETGQLAGGRTSGDNSQKVTEKQIRSDVIKWITGQEEGLTSAAQVLSVMDSVTMFFNKHLKKHGFIQGRTKGMLACYPGNGTYYRRHVDNPNKDGRRITCILYLNKDWDVQKDGGLLRIFPPYSDEPLDIPPVANRLLFFWSDKRNPHEVQPAFKDRYAMTVWYFDAEERDAAKADELKKETEEINAKIAELEEKKKQMEELTRLQEVQNKAMQHVQSLSEEELQVLSMLISTHPNPRQALALLGVSDVVYDALVNFLNIPQGRR